MSTTRRTRSEDRSPSRPAGGRSSPTPGPRRDRLRRRLVPAVALAGVAFAVGIAVGAHGGDDGRKAVESYARAWSAGDWAGMHAQLTEEDRRATPLLAFAQLNRDALATATAGEHSVRAGKPVKGDGDTWRVPVTVRRARSAPSPASSTSPSPRTATTTAWRGPPARLPGAARRRAADARHVDARPREHPRARRHRRWPRAPDRTSTIPDVAAQVVGQLGPIPAERAQELYARSAIPADAQVGAHGPGARSSTQQLAGIPGGRAARRARACWPVGAAGAPARRAHDDRPEVERAAIAALGGRFGGIAVPSSRAPARSLAFAGVAFSGLQPPGLDLQDHHAAARAGGRHRRSRPTSTRSSEATLYGVDLQNANGESAAARWPPPSRCRATRSSPRSAPSSARRSSSTRRGGFGFNEPTRDPRRGESTIPARGRDRRRPRRRLHRDRTGPRPGDAAADGARGGDDRQRRRRGRARRSS